MRLEIDFKFDVGDFVTLEAAKDQECPQRLQIVALGIVKNLENTHKEYHVRAAGEWQNPTVFPVQEPELLPYPSDEEIAARVIERQAQRAEMNERINKMRADRKAKEAAPEAHP